MQRYLSFYDDVASGWERALYAFLAEKQRRSGSERTTQTYSRMLQHFFARAGKPPDQLYFVSRPCTRPDTSRTPRCGWRCLALPCPNTRAIIDWITRSDIERMTLAAREKIPFLQNEPRRRPCIAMPRARPRGG